MIKEISQVTRDNRFLSLETEFNYATDSPPGPVMTAKMVEVKPGIFVDDTINAEYALIKDVVKACEEAGNALTLHRHRAVPEDLYQIDYYDSILDEAEDLAGMLLFKNTDMFRPTYLVISSDLLPLFRFTKHFRMKHPHTEPPYIVKGTCTVGTYKDIPVLVSPFLDRGQMLFGVNQPMNTGIVTFTKHGKVCYKITNPKYFALLTLED